VARLLSILLVLGLLGGTAAAFAITEGLKLEKSPITKTHVVNQLFSPVCNCPKDFTEVRFTLRKGDTLTATVITRSGDPVETLADHYFRAGPPVKLRWNGRDSAGAVVSDGPYRLRIHLQNRHQTITLPNTLTVKTDPALIAIRSVVPRVFSPDNDGRAEPPGVYRLSLRAEDPAGNISPPTRDVPVLLRFLTLSRSTVHVRPGKRFALGVSSDAKVVHWLLRGRTGEGAPGTLQLRAPAKPGTYRLFVTSNGHSQAALVVVAK
jgi:hypothetical protein